MSLIPPRCPCGRGAPTGTIAQSIYDGLRVGRYPIQVTYLHDGCVCRWVPAERNSVYSYAAYRHRRVWRSRCEATCGAMA